MTATATRDETTHEAGRCSLCGLLPDFCPCDRHDLFDLADAPLQIEVTVFGRAAVATVRHYTVTDDGRLLPTEETDDRAA